jgi:hypothetical protein
MSDGGGQDREEKRCGGREGRELRGGVGGGSELDILVSIAARMGSPRESDMAPLAGAPGQTHTDQGRHGVAQQIFRCGEMPTSI